MARLLRIQLNPRGTMRCWFWSTVVLLAGCGGSGGGGEPFGPPTVGSGYVRGIFPPSTQYKGLCATPRPGNSQDRPGRTLDENLWLRSWTNELYLWYAEVPDRDPAGMSPLAYFDLLKTPALTPSGQPKDRFHFTWNTAEYQAFVQSGASAGYGIEFAILQRSPPRRAVVAYVEPNSPAAQALVQRGAELVSVDGVDFVNGSDTTTINNGLFPTAAGQPHTLVLRGPGSAPARTLNFTSEIVTSTPVQNVTTIPTATGPVGYLLFNDHIATAEGQLINAVNTLRAQGITDLMLDIRYNGGGFLYIASELAYMIAGVRTQGRTFERLQFNDKYPTRNPVTGQPLTPTPFYNTSQNNVPLPTLNLPRVFVLTGSGTCSASESIMNALRGINVEVIQIGSTTCGKPYGFYPQDNCGTTYFSIQFRGINDVGFGDYADGFSPANTVGIRGVSVRGCSVADDFSRALGDSQEGRLAAALNFRATGQCPTPPSGLSENRLTLHAVEDDGRIEPVMTKSPLRENRWL